MKRSCHPTGRGKGATGRQKVPRSAGSLRRSCPTPYQWKYGVRSDPLDQGRACHASSPTSRGDEAKLDPKILSLINAACAQVQARSARVCFSFSLVALENPCMASLAYCRNRSASLMTASRRGHLCWCLLTAKPVPARTSNLYRIAQSLRLFALSPPNRN
jgi:hypothetical protein